MTIKLHQSKEHSEDCSIFHNSIDECDCFAAKIEGLIGQVKSLSEHNQQLKLELKRQTDKFLYLLEHTPKPNALRKIGGKIGTINKDCKEAEIELFWMADRIEKAIPSYAKQTI